MARISGVDLPRNKRIDIALTYIFGIGRTLADEIVERAVIEHPLLEELATVGPEAVLITALSASHQDLVRHQAAHLAGHRPATASESTF